MIDRDEKGWREEALAFDSLYSGKATESGLPVFGKIQQRRLEERLMRSLDFVRLTGATRVLDVGCGAGRSLPLEFGSMRTAFLTR